MRNIDTAVLFLVLVTSIFAGYFAFNDFTISELIVNEQSGWAGYLERFGELPGIIVIVSGIMIYAIQLNHESTIKLVTFQTILIIALSAILVYVSYILVFSSSYSENNFKNHLPYLFSAFIIASAAAILFFRRIKLKISPALIIISKIVLGTAFFGYLLSIQLIKLFWGRVRYRDLDLIGSDYTEWYIANGINGNQSFPSGHAAMGWMLLTLFLLVMNKNKYVKSISIILIISLATIISISRVVIGAHYASDVLFGSFFIIITFLILCRRYYSIDKK